MILFMTDQQVKHDGKMWDIEEMTEKGGQTIAHLKHGDDRAEVGIEELEAERVMVPLDGMTLNERVKLYSEGDLENEIPRHSFDFTKEDEENIMNALRIVWLLSREDFVHDFQRERKDIVDYCITTTGIIRIAKRFVKQCPLSTKFRLNYKKE